MKNGAYKITTFLKLLQSLRVVSAKVSLKDSHNSALKNTSLGWGSATWVRLVDKVQDAVEV